MPTSCYCTQSLKIMRTWVEEKAPNPKRSIRPQSSYPSPSATDASNMLQSIVRKLLQLCPQQSSHVALHQMPNVLQPYRTCSVCQTMALQVFSIVKNCSRPMSACCHCCSRSAHNQAAKLTEPCKSQKQGKHQKFNQMPSSSKGTWLGQAI